MNFYEKEKYISFPFWHR